MGYEEEMANRVQEVIEEAGADESLTFQRLWVEMFPSREEVKNAMEKVSEREPEFRERIAEAMPSKEWALPPEKTVGKLYGGENYHSRVNSASAKGKYPSPDDVAPLVRECEFWSVWAKGILEKSIQTLENAEIEATPENIARLLCDERGFKTDLIKEIGDKELYEFWVRDFPGLNPLLPYMLVRALLSPVLEGIGRDMTETDMYKEGREGYSPGLKDLVRYKHHEKKLEELKELVRAAEEQLPSGWLDDLPDVGAQER